MFERCAQNAQYQPQTPIINFDQIKHCLFFLVSYDTTIALAFGGLMSGISKRDSTGPQAQFLDLRPLVS
jgi:hypothetical protein